MSTNLLTGSFAGFRPASEGVGCAHGRVGQAHYGLGLQVFPSLPAKKFASLSSKNLRACILYSRTKVSGTAHPLYAAVAAARENSEVSDMGRVIVCLYEFARTHFIQNTTP
jgi:hypothetical protein